MKTLLLLFLVPVIVYGQICNSNGNVVLYSNYDGGDLVINVDEDIQDLKIGVVSYEAVRVTFTGAYTSNVTGIVVAGFGGSNDPCNLNLSGNSIVNYPGGSLLMTTAPSATLANSNGNQNIICAYSCDINSSQGGCNTVDQIEDYMLNQFANSSIRSHTVQYNCWNTNQLVSAGGNCCLNVVTNPIEISFDGVNPNCYGVCNGSISSTITGGDGTYSYSWSGSSETTSDLEDLCAGEYTLTVTDGNGDQASETIVLVEPDEINLSVTIASAIVCNGEEATIQVTAANGVEPYTGDGTQTYAAGTHTITVEDGNGCEATEEITIVEPDEIVVSSNSTDSIEGCNGEITLSISGGDSPYTVQWGANANNQTGETVSDLCPDIYCATVTDANGCEVEVCDSVNGFTSTSSLQSNNESGFVVFPNPSGKTTTLRLNSFENESVRIEIYDHQGKLVLTETHQTEKSTKDIEVSVANKGVYMVRVIGEKATYTKSWVVIN